MSDSRHLFVIVLVGCAACGDDGSTDADSGRDEGVSDLGEEPMDAPPDVDAIVPEAGLDGGSGWDGRDLPDVAWDLPACVTSYGIVARQIVEDEGRPILLTNLVAERGRAAIAWDSRGPHVARIDGSEIVELSIGADPPDEIIGLGLAEDELLAAGTFSEGGTPLLGLVSFGVDATDSVVADAPPWAAHSGLTGLWATPDERWLMGVFEPRAEVEGETGPGLRILHVSRALDLLSPPRWLETGADTMFPGIEQSLVRVVGGPDDGDVVRKIIWDERGRGSRAVEIIPFSGAAVEDPIVVSLNGAYRSVDDIDVAQRSDGALAVLIRSRLDDIPAPTLLASVVRTDTGAMPDEPTVFAETAGRATAVIASSRSGADVFWQPYGEPSLHLCISVVDLAPCAEPLRVGAGASADEVLARRDGADLVVAWREVGPFATTDAGTRRVEGIYWARLTCD
ncbi:MAG: hypothetical protein IT379_38625 [Deltaproteobacteria bacterium]|nr:hypothetical protein [Deltaproteobacteria bacterium]